MEKAVKIMDEKIAKIMKDNPDLPYEFVKNILTALEEIRDGLIEPYEFGDQE